MSGAAGERDLLLALLDQAFDRPSCTGIAAHDLYHAGQVQLLKRLAAEKR